MNYPWKRGGDAQTRDPNSPNPELGSQFPGTACSKWFKLQDRYRLIEGANSDHKEVAVMRSYYKGIEGSKSYGWGYAVEGT